MGILYNRFCLIRPVRYGIRINESNQSVEYLYDAVGFTPALMNTSTGVLDYGSWADTLLMQSNYPAVTTDRNYTTAIDYKLNPNDYSKKIDGTNSDITNPSGDVVAVFEGGWLYTYEETVSDVKYIYIIWSNVQYDSNYQCYHRDNHKSFAVGVYTTDSSKTSRSNQTVSSTYDSTKAIKWAQLNYIYCLMMIITKSVTSFKTNLGLMYSISMTVANSPKTGKDNSRGQFYTYYDGDYKNTTNKVFHIEDIFRVVGNGEPAVADISASSGSAIQNRPYYITANGVTQTTSSFQYTSVSGHWRCGLNVPHIFASPQGIFPTGVTYNSVSNYSDIQMNNVAEWTAKDLMVTSYNYSNYLGFTNAGTRTMHISHYID